MRFEDVRKDMKIIMTKKYECVEKGEVGVVKFTENNYREGFVSVEFEREDEDARHSCGGKCKNGYGYWIPVENFKLYIEKLGSTGKYLTYDEIRNLPHGTKIKFTDNYDGRDNVKNGIINQENKMIGGYGNSDNINNCIWYFYNLEEYKVQAYLNTDEMKIHNKNEVHNMKLIFSNTTTIAILQDKNGKTIKKSLAKLDPNDTYDKGEGIKIAVLRVLGEEVKLKEDTHECKCNKKELKDYTNDELLEEVKRRFYK
jgi:hypothetical protein